MAKSVDDILKEADAVDLKNAFADKTAPQAKGATATTAAAADPSKFCSSYGTTRPILLSVVSLLKLFHRGDAANAIASTVAFLDLTCGGGGTP
ncbi:MAG TPA: hypothetical protein VGC66_03745 [Pyrinomonadaceae bacterium]|jgi:hypothetical protein